jgi:GT2 family glycosyltransferase/SAM-dependent methyltransferase
LTNINDDILATFGGTWDEPPEFPASWESSAVLTMAREHVKSILETDFSDARQWGWKDPRNSLTLPFWKLRFPALRCVVCLRNPVDVALSLQRRNGFPFDKSIGLWLKYTSSAIAHTLDVPCMFVFYEDVMEDWRTVADRLSSFVGSADHVEREEASSLISESIDQELRHHSASVNEAIEEPRIGYPAKALYLVLRSTLTGASPVGKDLTVDNDALRTTLMLFGRYSVEAQAGLDVLQARAESTSREMEGATQSLRKTQREKDILADQLAEAKGVVQGLRSTIETRDRTLASMVEQVADQGRMLEEWQPVLAERDQLAERYEGLAAERDRLIRGKERAEAELRRSMSELAYIHSRLAMRLVQAWWQLQARWAPPGSSWGRVRVWLRTRLGGYLARLIDVKPIPAPAVADPSGRTLDAMDPARYQRWIEENEPSPDELDRQRLDAERLPYRPHISVVIPAFNTPPSILREALDSVVSQTYDHWELCLALGGSGETEQARIIQDYASHEKRIKAKILGTNRGISANSNAALQLASGEFVVLLDHDDTLAPFALYEVAKCINETKDVDFIYSDKDMLSEDGSRRFSPLFKPDWSPESMLGANYLTHLNAIRRSLIEEVGGFDPRTDGAQDWDLFLRVVEKTDRIAHIEKVLYHWRESPTSVARGIHKKPYAHASQVRAVVGHLQRQGLPAEAAHTVQGDLRVKWPLSRVRSVSIIVSTRKDGQQLRQYMRRLAERTRYPSYEVVFVTPNPPARETLIQGLPTETRVVLVPCSEGLSRAATNNLGKANATGECLLFLSDTLAPHEKDWLEELVRWLECKQVGAVGAQLLNPDGTLAHAGLVVGLGGFRGHPFAGSAEMRNGPFGSAYWYRNYSAVSGDCLLVSRDDFDAAGGFDEAFEDGGEEVVLCRRLANGGKRTVYTPFSRLAYPERHEPRPQLSIPDSAQVELRDILENGDPYFNQNLSLDHPVPAVRTGPRMKPLAPIDQAWRQRSTVASPTPLARGDLGLSVRHRSPKAVLKSLVKAPGVWDRYSEDAATLVGLFDFDQSDLESSNRLMETNSGPMDIRSISWFLPDFDYAYYGGLHTIFRFAAFLRDNRGIANRFVVLGDTSPSRVSSAIGEAFPTLRGEAVNVVRSRASLADLPPSDAAVATLWTTAYALLKFNNVRRKFYFIQDFEPMFYPAGSTYAQAEATYRFGFYGIANTQTLAAIYRTEYGGRAEFFNPAIDTSVFYPQQSPKAQGSPYSVFFYARPGHPRNAFELGVRALSLLKEELGDRVRVLAAGDNWNPSQRGLSGVIENLGRLTYAETGELYRQCDAGLVMMFTRHPSYLPLELMASGCAVVSNFNPATSWLLRDGQNCLLASPSPTSLAKTIKTALLDTEQRSRITRSALDMVLSEFSDWQSQIQKTYAFMCQPDDREVKAGMQQHAPSRAPLTIEHPPGTGGTEAAEDVTDNGERVTPDRADWGYYAHLSIYSFATGFTAGKRVLDAGCGTGYGSHYLLTQGAEHVEAIDYSERAIAFCRRRYPEVGLHFEAMDLCGELRLKDSDFDVAFSSNVMEHLASPDGFLAHLIRILRPGGIFIMAVPPIVTQGMLEANLKNPYHIANHTPLAWSTKLKRYFQAISGYRHWVKDAWKGDNEAPKGIGLPPSETSIRETDFTFEEMPIAKLNALTANITAVFVARDPRTNPLDPEADEGAFPEEWDIQGILARARPNPS